MKTTTMKAVEKQTKRFARAHKKLTRTLEKLNGQIQKAQRRFLEDIKTWAGVAGLEKGSLATMLLTSPELFKDPRTVVFHGVKVGLHLGQPTIQVTNEDATIRAIEADGELSQKADALIDTERSVNAKGLAGLTDAQLARIHATRVPAKNVVVIKPTGGDVEKAAAALLKEAYEAWPENTRVAEALKQAA